jgi:hypothetical protein
VQKQHGRLTPAWQQDVDRRCHVIVEKQTPCPLLARHVTR